MTSETGLRRAARSWRLPAATVAVMIVGAAASLAPDGARARNAVWILGLALCGGPLVVRTIAGLLRGRFAADVVASLAVIVAFLLGQPLVGLVIVLMQSGGEALERIAEGRATDALRALQDAAPRTVHVLREGELVDVDSEAVAVGDTILVRPGEVIPCDGEVASGRSHIDTSRITGEPVPISAGAGTAVMSGTVNQEGPLMVHVTAAASESQYARIVQLVREAQASKAPLQRAADRYAIWFTPLTVAMCGLAYAFTGEWNTVLAVLAVATPCPLILATPVAVLGGMNRAAHRHVLLRNGGALEALGEVTAVIFDKTGTVTIGRPRVSRVIAFGGNTEERVLELASAVERLSGHLLARTIVDEAESRGVPTRRALLVTETPGRGVEGQVDSAHVLIGARSFIAERVPDLATRIDAVETEADHASLRAYVAVNEKLAGIIEYADMVRPGMRDMVRKLSAIGVRYAMLLSGDREENVSEVASAIGIRIARGELLPEDKVEAVRSLLARGERVLMMGDGTNDAPALSAATVGAALASQGRGIATESAGVILLVDEPARIIDAIQISRRTMSIARQSIFVGLGASAIGMTAAALGLIPPIGGALLQEGIDLAVIANALRASMSPRVKETPKENPPEPYRPARSPDLPLMYAPARAGGEMEVLK